jgi:thiosulfate/3-mercaptopyruvate sulfurtransferase
MPYTTLISTLELDSHLFDPEWAIVDCRFDLTNPDWGARAYPEAHIPGAVYAHLDHDLSGPKTGRNGRHPLPETEAFRARLSAWGIDPEVQVVAYDQANGMWASRLWWMLRWMGHPAAAVLEGGLAQWLAEGRPTLTGVETRRPRAFTGQPQPALAATVEEIERLRQDPAYRLIDARAPERYRGEVEPFDPVAGHIPGAANLFNVSNVEADGTFLAPEALRAKFLALLGDVPPANVVTYCGSGVAAAHNVLAMEVAGLPGARVYVGSWSEWCADPGRPVARGGSANDP